MENHCCWFCLNLFLISSPHLSTYQTQKVLEGGFGNNEIIPLGLTRSMRFCHAVKREKNIPGRQKSITGQSGKVYGQLWGSGMQRDRGGRDKD